MSRTFRSAVCILGVLLSSAAAFGARHQTWVEVRTPHFIIISNAGGKEALKSAVQFEQIRTLFRENLKFAGNAHTPVITVFAVKDEGSMRTLLPEYWAKGHVHPAGIFFGRLKQYYAAVQLDAPGDNPYQAMYHEYYHSLSLPYFPGLPLWLAEGLADFFGNSRISGTKAYMGQASETVIQELRENRFIPLDVLFSVDHSSPYYNEENKVSEFYAESWALTHYLMIGDNGAHRQLLANYLAALDRGDTQQQAAAKAFGNLAALQQALQNYIGNYEFYQVVAPAPPAMSGSGLQVSVLSDAEIDAERGGFEAVRGRTEDATPLLEEAVRLDPKLALAYQNLALAELFDGQQRKALNSVSQAISIDPRNSLTRYLRAYLTMANAGIITQDDSLEADLRQSIAADPDFAPAPALLAVYLSMDHKALPEALSLAQRAILLQPGTAGFRLDLAQVLIRMRRYADAQAAILSARAAATDPAERAQANQLLATVQQLREADAGGVPAPGGDAANAPDPRRRGAPEVGAPSAPEAPPVDSSAREMTGVVTQVSCGNGMQLRVAAAAGTYRFYVQPGERIQLEMHSQPTAGFNPCSSLKGMRVTAHYEPGSAKGLGGQLEVLEILGPGDQ
jgi:Protein of unknown function (DUF1570)